VAVRSAPVSNVSPLVQDVDGIKAAGRIKLRHYPFFDVVAPAQRLADNRCPYAPHVAS
jgi:hypothetical protein